MNSFWDGSKYHDVNENCETYINSYKVQANIYRDPSWIAGGSNYNDNSCTNGNNMYSTLEDPISHKVDSNCKYFDQVNKYFYDANQYTSQPQFNENKNNAYFDAITGKVYKIDNAGLCLVLESR